ncbi:hypothetical protein Tdes44962_MAKER07941 [Teratosphaeria destructans]|uniref:Uncharacterized protein n=1 Tax=Teratosphaeria destructans TaxID=418781 RepID=A0A9W7W545_9PEZI|nr:hypothetical protein Tdes44962_MAKER07941 [Teratosphaeria destructans]
MDALPPSVSKADLAAAERQTFFSLPAAAIILAQPFDLDANRNDALTHYIATDTATDILKPFAPFNHLTPPSGQLLASAAEHLDMLTGHPVLDYGLLAGLLRVVARRLRKMDASGSWPKWFLNEDETALILSDADVAAERSMLTRKEKATVKHDRNPVPGGDFPLKPEWQQKLRVLFADRKLFTEYAQNVETVGHGLMAGSALLTAMASEMDQENSRSDA